MACKSHCGALWSPTKVTQLLVPQAGPRLAAVVVPVLEVVAAAIWPVVEGRLLVLAWLEVPLEVEVEEEAESSYWEPLQKTSLAELARKKAVEAHGFWQRVLTCLALQQELGCSSKWQALSPVHLQTHSALPCCNRCCQQEASKA